MEALGIWFAAVAVADLVAGPSGEIGSSRRAVIGGGAGCAVAIALGAAVGFPWYSVTALAAWTAPTLFAWMWSRLPAPWSARRAGAVLAGAAAAISIAAAGASAWPATDGGVIQELLDRQPYDAIAGSAADRVLLIAGSVLLLQATGNALVRLLLSLAGTPVSAQQRLRGGRFIGPMERTLIFGLGLAGYLTAAAVVATAKSLLRFPEISRETQADIHSATEYFLLGSMASWILALAMLVLL